MILPIWDTDVEDTLVDQGYEVRSVADAGDTLENMAFNGQLRQIADGLQIIALYGHFPRAILLSVGGNDVIGPDLTILLNHSKSSLGSGTDEEALLNKDILEPVLSRFSSYTSDYIRAISLLCKGFYDSYDYYDSGKSRDLIQQLKLLDQSPCSSIPIIIHGYDYPIPSGIGYRILGLFGAKGPWLKPAFEMKNIRARGNEEEDAVRKVVLEYIVDAYNGTLENTVQSLQNIANPVCYLNLRKVVQKERWADEAHPNKDAMKDIARKFSDEIRDCGPQ